MTNSSKKHFLFLNYHSTPKLNGKEKLHKFSFSFGILKELEKKYNVSVVDFGSKTSSFKEFGISYYFFKKSNNHKINFPFSAQKKILNLQPEIIYLQGINYIYLLFLIYPFFKTKPLIVVQNHAETVSFSKIKLYLLRFFSKIISVHIFTATELAQPWVDSKITKASSVFIQPEISTLFSYDITVKKDPNLFIWVARLIELKDPLTVINSFIKYIKHYNAKAKLILFYSENNLEKEAKTKIQEANLENQIILKGKIEHASLEHWYQKSSFFILASSYEGGSIALTEAIACKCIPIVSNIPANKALVKDYGLIFEKGNVLDLLNTLQHTDYINKNDLRNKLTKHFSDNLSFKALAEGLYTCLNTKNPLRG